MLRIGSGGVFDVFAVKASATAGVVIHLSIIEVLKLKSTGYFIISRG
jgi:hypothetical protein